MGMTATGGRREALSGPLLKAGEHTALLRRRHFRLSAPGPRLEYWESEAQMLSALPPRGQGTILGAAEWWPSSSGKLDANLLRARDSRYDGCAFEVQMRPSDRAPAQLHLFASSHEERLGWLCAIAELLRAPTAAAGAPDGAPDGEATGEPIEKEAESSAEESERAQLLLSVGEAWSLWQRGEDEAALSTYARVLGVWPRCWQALQDRGVYYLRRNELRRADADLSAALVIERGRALLWNDRAACRLESERPADALADLDEAIALDEGLALSHSNRGNALRALGRHAEAKLAFRRALDLSPADAIVWNNRGALQEQLGNLVAAALDYGRALELDPAYGKAADNHARVVEALREEGAEEEGGGVELEEVSEWGGRRGCSSDCEI